MKDAKAAVFLWHRNPQGMTKHPVTGEIWTHEHGPRGGDEINIVQAGKNVAIGPMKELLWHYQQKIALLWNNLYTIDSIGAPSGMAFVHNSKYADWEEFGCWVTEIQLLRTLSYRE